MLAEVPDDLFRELRRGGCEVPERSLVRAPLEQLEAPLEGRGPEEGDVHYAHGKALPVEAPPEGLDGPTRHSGDAHLAGVPVPLRVAAVLPRLGPARERRPDGAAADLGRPVHPAPRAACDQRGDVGELTAFGQLANQRALGG